MITKIKVLTATLIATTILTTSGLVMAATAPSGALAAAQDTSYTLSEMITYAMEDENLAKAEYAAIIAKYGSQRPYSNIIRAEDNHIAQLQPLFAAYKVTVPAAPSAEVTLPATLAETYQIGITAETNNIAMYESFLKLDLPADVKLVFTNLKNASEKHLAAFERATSGDYTGSRLGAGNPNGIRSTGNMNGSCVNGDTNGNTNRTTTTGSANMNRNGRGNGNANRIGRK